MSQTTDLQRAKQRIETFERGRPLHRRRMHGLDGDYKIIDENGKEVWASQLARRYFRETYPRPVMLHRS